MNKGKEQKLVSLTEQCLVEYWNKNCEFVLGYCAKDVAWTGAEQTQYMQGVEAVRADFLLHEAVIQPCMITNGEFMAAQSSGNTCTVVGRYLVETTKEAEYYICAEQRCTFVWEYSGKGPVIRHIHVSNPIGEMKIAEGKHFVNEMGKMARKYMEERIEDILGKRFMVEDLNGISHVLQSMDILYAEASLRYCIINLRGGRRSMPRYPLRILKRWQMNIL